MCSLNNYLTRQIFYNFYLLLNYFLLLLSLALLHSHFEASSLLLTTLYIYADSLFKH
jgi:hypothetical protein